MSPRSAGRRTGVWRAGVTRADEAVEARLGEAILAQEHFLFLGVLHLSNLRLDGGRHQHHFGALLGYVGLQGGHMGVAVLDAALVHVGHVNLGLDGEQLQIGYCFQLFGRDVEGAGILAGLEGILELL